MSDEEDSHKTETEEEMVDEEEPIEQEEEDDRTNEVEEELNETKNEIEDTRAKKGKKARKKKDLKGGLQALLKAIQDAVDSSESEESDEEDTSTTTGSGSRKRKKRQRNREVREGDQSESSDEERKKFTLHTKMKVPTLEKGMTYAKYKFNVEMWENAMKRCMSREGMGVALVQALPDVDNRGGIKEQAWKQVGKEKLLGKEGVKHLIQFLDKKLLKTGFVRCIELNDKHTTIKHQEGWSIDKYIAEADLGSDERHGV